MSEQALRHLEDIDGEALKIAGVKWTVRVSSQPNTTELYRITCQVEFTAELTGEVLSENLITTNSVMTGDDSTKDLLRYLGDWLALPQSERKSPIKYLVTPDF